MMNVIETKIPDVKLIQPRRFDDERGFFQQTYHYEQYAEAGIAVRFVQDNWSRSCKGVLRGLHYQFSNPQAKLVSVMHGKVFDVAVDKRAGSATFGLWGGEVLSEGNGHQMFIPEGFAHGFLVLSDRVDFMYKCSDFYAPGDECGIVWNDPQIGIQWPMLEGLIISEKDKMLPSFSAARIFE